MLEFVDLVSNPGIVTLETRNYKKKHLVSNWTGSCVMCNVEGVNNTLMIPLVWIFSLISPALRWIS